MIFKGLSSSKTRLRALSIGGIYDWSSVNEVNNTSLFAFIICISSIFLINFWVSKNLLYSVTSSFKKFLLLLVSNAIKTISDSILFLISST